MTKLNKYGPPMANRKPYAVVKEGWVILEVVDPDADLLPRPLGVNTVNKLRHSLREALGHSYRNLLHGIKLTKSRIPRKSGSNWPFSSNCEFSSCEAISTS